MKVTAISLISKICSSFICSITRNTALAQTHEDAFLQNASGRGNTWFSNMHMKQRMIISQLCQDKNFICSLLSKKTKSSSSAASERRKGMQTTYICEESLNEKASVFSEMLLLFLTTSCLVFRMQWEQNTTSLHTSKLYSRLNFATFQTSVFNTFLSCIITLM